jgi:hypothetical protein
VDLVYPILLDLIARTDAPAPLVLR